LPDSHAALFSWISSLHLCQVFLYILFGALEYDLSLGFNSLVSSNSGGKTIFTGLFVLLELLEESLWDLYG
jgi:hypothetical protein